MEKTMALRAPPNVFFPNPEPVPKGASVKGMNREIERKHEKDGIEESEERDGAKKERKKGREKSPEGRLGGVDVAAGLSKKFRVDLNRSGVAGRLPAAGIVDMVVVQSTRRVVPFK